MCGIASLASFLHISLFSSGERATGFYPVCEGSNPSRGAKCITYLTNSLGYVTLSVVVSQSEPPVRV